MPIPQYIDISIPVDSKTPVFPGDPGPEVSWPCFSHTNGDDLNLGVYKGGLHVGTHVDAPWHYIQGGDTLEKMSLDYWIGECYVLDIADGPSIITGDLLASRSWPRETRRLLLRTGNSLSRYWERGWTDKYCYLDATAAEYLVQKKIVTLGFDYVTVEGIEAREFPTHKRLLGAKIAILEGLNLERVREGTYELIAAPVKLAGVDGAWCRALLRVA